MPAPSLSRLPAALLASAALAATAIGGTAVTVTDQKGRAIEIELISLSGDSVTFRRQGQPKEFTLPVSQFDQASRELIRKQAGQLPAVTPKIQPEVIIGKRRHKDNSWYMVKQEISCTLKLTNLSGGLGVPPVSGKLVFIGQNQRAPELLCVLSTQSVGTSIKPGQTISQEMETFFTAYDSENKGFDNVGGYQYFGYILVLADEGGRIVLDHTTTGSIRLALNNRPAILKEILGYQQNKLLTDKLEPSTDTRRGGILR